MIQNLQVLYSQDFNPYFNLALEEFLLNTLTPDTMILYLWQNENTVVIGRNQNAWKECKVSALEEDHGYLARRLSGGGAVYHDLGNLNFTFITNMDNYNIERQSNVIIRALAYEGVKAEKSGRNDLLVDGKKFSGNAYYQKHGNAYHHGTILVDVDMKKMGQYLNVSATKLKSNGVDSVRSRVMNMKEVIPDLTIEGMKQLMVRALGDEYGLPVKSLTLSPGDVNQIMLLTQRYQSSQWKFHKKIKSNLEIMDRFIWGDIHLELELEGDIVKECIIYSDAMDTDFIAKLTDAIQQSPFQAKLLTNALEQLKHPFNAVMIDDVQRLILHNL